MAGGRNYQLMEICMTKDNVLPVC